MTRKDQRKISSRERSRLNQQITPIPANVTRKLRRVAQFHREHDEFSEPSLRWLIFKAKENGLERAGGVVRLGRRVFLDPEKFFLWLDAQQPYRVLGGTDNLATVPMAVRGRED